MSEKDPRSNADHGTDCGCFDYRRMTAKVERLEAELESGWNALGLRRTFGDVFIADGINRLREMHSEQLHGDDGDDVP